MNCALCGQRRATVTVTRKTSGSVVMAICQPCAVARRRRDVILRVVLIACLAAGLIGAGLWIGAAGS